MIYIYFGLTGQCTLKDHFHCQWEALVPAIVIHLPNQEVMHDSCLQLSIKQSGDNQQHLLLKSEPVPVKPYLYNDLCNETQYVTFLLTQKIKAIHYI